MVIVNSHTEMRLNPAAFGLVKGSGRLAALACRPANHRGREEVTTTTPEGVTTTLPEGVTTTAAAAAATTSTTTILLTGKVWP